MKEVRLFEIDEAESLKAQINNLLEYGPAQRAFTVGRGVMEEFRIILNEYIAIREEVEQWEKAEKRREADDPRLSGVK